jgi:hypothetical protein
MRSAIRLRLHLPPADLEMLRTTACPCGGGDLRLDPLHFHSCSRLRRTAQTTRHDIVLQELVGVAKELQIPCRVEPRPKDLLDPQQQGESHLAHSEEAPQGQAHPAESAQSGSGRKPDLHFILAHHRVVEVLSDVAVAHPGAASYASSASTHPLSAAKHIQSHKISKYADLVQAGQSEMIAFVMETFGAFGPQANKLLQCFFKQGPGPGKDFGDDGITLQDARTQLSFALQRGNAIVARKGVEMLCSEYDLHVRLPHHLH